MSLAYVLIIHEVKEYKNWKKVFDDAAIIRKNAGEKSYQVMKYENEPNKVVHFSFWNSIQDAKQFFESEELVKIRELAGVKSPTFIYLNHLESGVL
jgi:heme-degrading monooxygenase HmoA